MTCKLCGKDIGRAFYRNCEKCGTVHALCDPCIKDDRITVHGVKVPKKEGNHE